MRQKNTPSLIAPAVVSSKEITYLGSAVDERTGTTVIYAQVRPEKYLNMVGDDFDTFEIQRPKTTHKSYKRMREDIKKGALLPTITLSVRHDKVDDLLKVVGSGDPIRISRALESPGQFHILDGLQRTHILKEVSASNEGRFLSEQTLHLEIWLEKEIKHLIYRIIVLNAGQKQMSLRHQIELLFLSLKQKIEAQVNVELIKERDGARRKRARQYSLDRIAVAFHCFAIRSSETSKENLIANELHEAAVLERDEDALERIYELFIRALEDYVALDVEICRVYPTSEEGIPSGLVWVGGENVISSYFGAVSFFLNSDNDSIQDVLERKYANAHKALLKKLKSSNVGDDPLGLDSLTRLNVEGHNPRKVNVGTAQRRLMLNGFKEYFRNGGEEKISRCWQLGAE